MQILQRRLELFVLLTLAATLTACHSEPTETTQPTTASASGTVSTSGAGQVDPAPTHTVEEKHNSPSADRTPPTDPMKIGQTRTNPVDEATLIWIPPGPFIMGTNDIADADGKQNTGNPRHSVTIDGYWIYKNDVTIGMFRQFMKASGFIYDWNKYKPDGGWIDDHPMVYVSWNDAKAYTAWASVKLPTAEQWEKAARGPNGNLYPWGDEWDASKLQCSKNDFGDAGGTSTVGSYPQGASPYGVLDMAGNVYQMCEDKNDRNSYFLYGNCYGIDFLHKSSKMQSFASQ